MGKIRNDMVQEGKHNDSDQSRHQRVWSLEGRKRTSANSPEVEQLKENTLKGSGGRHVI